MLGEMDEQVILGNFVDELYYKQCNHEESDINKSPLLMSKSTSDMYHEEYNHCLQYDCQFLHDFNPRTHEGYDNATYVLLQTRNNFNPRTHEGYDVYDVVTAWRLKTISIHVPTKGTTL